MADDLLHGENSNPDDDFMPKLDSEGNMKDEEFNTLLNDFFEKNKDSKQWKREYRSISNFNIDDLKEPVKTEYKPKLHIDGSKGHVNSNGDIINTIDANILPIPECQDKLCSSVNKCKKCKFNMEKLFGFIGTLSLNSEELGIENKITFVPSGE